MSHLPAGDPGFGPSDPRLRRRVGRWLVAWSVMLLLTVVIGGVTRLTESGLSITEWKPVAGVLPPLSDSAWQSEFRKYQQIPEYREQNLGMDLAGFKRIYLVEYVHRLWARIVGLAIGVPLLVLLIRGGLGPVLKRRLLLLLLLMGLQGAMGWYMVKSGLSERTDVSQYRLAAHLLVALALIGIAVWSAADLLRKSGPAPSDPALRRLALALVALVLLSATAGAFVAGLDAGRAYNTFPLMGGRVVPLGYSQLQPWYRNLFEHIPAVQFNHRLLGVLSVLLAGWVWHRSRRAASTVVRNLGRAAGLTAIAQAGLGIATLLLFVPIPLASLHQAGAVVLLVLALLLVHALRPMAASASISSSEGSESAS